MMAAEDNVNAEMTKTGGKTGLRVLLGLLLLSPAALCCLVGLALPTLGTLAASLTDWRGMGGVSFVGLENYARLSEDPQLANALAYTWGLALVRVLVVAVVPLLLAFFVNEFGRAVRIPVRLLFTVPLALFAPVVAALVWGLVLNPRVGPLNALLQALGQPLQQWLARPETAGVVLRFADGLTTFALACGVGLVFYLAALRGRGDRPFSWRMGWKPLLTTWVAGLLATIALTFQALVFSRILTNGGPGGATLTLGLYQFVMAFQRFVVGYGATLASLGLLIVAIAGFAVTLLVILFGLRLETVAWGKKSGVLTSGGGRKIVPVLLLVLMLLVGIGGCSLSVLPRLWNGLSALVTPDAFGMLDQALRVPPGRAWGNSLLAPLVAILVVQLPVAYLGALGIGALRPFKKGSEWLLLPFAPWLFATASPLSIVLFFALRSVGLLDTTPGLMVPLFFSVPVLFVLTLFFKGQEPKWRAAQAEGQPAVKAFFAKLILPSLPLTALLACVSLLLSIQALLWPMLVLREPEKWPMTVALVALSGGGMALAQDVVGVAALLLGLPSFVIFFVAFGLFQALYMDRLSLVAAEGGPNVVAEHADMDVVTDTGAEHADLGEVTDAGAEGPVGSGE